MDKELLFLLSMYEAFPQGVILLGNEIQIVNSATVQSHKLILFLRCRVTSRAIVLVGVYLAPKWLTAG